MKFLKELESILKQLVDAETGQRGFIVTGEERYLDPYETGIVGVVVAMDTVEFLTADNPAQQERLTRLRPVVDSKLAELAATIELRRKPGTGFEESKAIVLTDAGKHDADAIRAIVDEMIMEEHSLLEVRSAAATDSETATKNIIVFGTLTGLVIAMAVILLISRSVNSCLAKIC